MCIRIFREKILELRGLLEVFIVRKKVKVCILELLVGKFNFFSKVVRGG